MRGQQETTLLHHHHHRRHHHHCHIYTRYRSPCFCVFAPPPLPPVKSAAVRVLNKSWNEQIDDDVDRASTLMALYEIRAKLKDQDSSRNLSKLREKIDALHAKQMLAEKKDGDGGRMKFSYPKAS